MTNAAQSDTTITLGVTTTGYTATVNTEDGPDQRWIEVFLIGAENARGDRWVLEHSETTTWDAAQLALIGVEVDPIANPDRWCESEPRYGSDAWDSTAEYSLACLEADAFDEPRPIW